MLDLTVADVAPATALLPELDFEQSVGEILRKPVEALSESPGRWVICNDAHPFARAAHDAFFGHYPLVISRVHTGARELGRGSGRRRVRG